MEKARSNNQAREERLALTICNCRKNVNHKLQQKNKPVKYYTETHNVWKIYIFKMTSKTKVQHTVILGLTEIFARKKKYKNIKTEKAPAISFFLQREPCESVCKCKSQF